MIVGVGLVVVIGLGYLIYALFNRGSHIASQSHTDPGDVAKSFGVALGLFLSMLAVTAGLIDLFQSFVEGDRLSGSNSDLARGLSLLIVGTPVFMLLARVVDRQRVKRLDAGDSRAGLGWSFYLVAASTTTLVGMLASIGQIITDISSSQNTVNAVEVAQLAGWSAIWALHWFGLRPRFGVRGNLHLLVGSALGLLWFVAGLCGVGTQILGQAYDNLFRDTFVQSGDPGLWLMVGVVGLATWLFHWRELNGPARRSDSWYAQVVGFAIVPAVIGLIAVGTGSIVGLLIWFLGSPDGSAVDWFDPLPGVLTVGMVARAVWAYHRWELERDGTPPRNDAMRFHDYAVALVALVGTVAALAGLFAMAFASTRNSGTLAGSVEVDNWLIGMLTLLVVAGSIWWKLWQRIERNRAATPVDEASSVWRKLYLGIGAGIGGLVLAGTAIAVIFSFLLALFDGELGGDTLDNIGGPLSWMIAVAAAAWFHITVWRSDRAILAGQQPVQPPPPVAPSVGAAEAPEVVNVAPGINLRWATATDAGELFTLQRAAFVDEAVAYGTPDVPALNETYDEFLTRTASIPTLVALDGSRIIGAVSLRDADGFAWLERLMVAPDRRNGQIGHQLVNEIGHHAPASTAGLRAVVGDRNPKLLEFYASLGFTTIGRTPAKPNIPELLVMQRADTP